MRSPVSDLSNHNATPAVRAFRWALPRSRHGYPGFHRGVTEIVGHWITPSGVQYWRTGRRGMPVVDAQRLRDHIAARIAGGRDIIAEPDYYIATESARPRRLAGCRAVGADGPDQRLRRAG